MCLKLDRISTDTPKLLESGELDLAAGFFLPMGAGFCQQRLFKERFVCALRKDHPRIDATRVSVKQFEAEGHLAIATLRNWPRRGGEGDLRAKRIRRRVGLTVPSFLGIVSIITSSDYIAIVPEQLGRHFSSSGSVKTVEVPFEIPCYQIMQHWHDSGTAV